MEWLPTWDQIVSIGALVVLIIAIVGFFTKTSETKKTKTQTMVDNLCNIQFNIAKILETIAKIEGKMDMSATQIIELERKHALTDQKLQAAWTAIDKIEKNCIEIQREKRKEQMG